MSNKLGVEKIEKLVGALSKLVVAGKKVSADGKVNAEDLGHVLPLLVELPVFVEAFSHLGQVLDEGKDLDVEEIVELVQLVNSKVKEIEKA